MNIVISPTLNERDNIDNLVESIMKLNEFHLLIVDDDSTDGTWQRVIELMKVHDRLHLLHRTRDHGFRNSYVDGMLWAINDEKYEQIYTMDADLSHKPEYLPEMKITLDQGADVVVGSRYTKGGGIENWSFMRLLLSSLANRFAHTVTGIPAKDCTAGFNGIKRASLKAIKLNSIKCEGYGFLIELKYLLWKSGAEIKEVPIHFKDREYGVTKFDSRMIIEAVKTCFRLRFSKP